MCVYTHEYDWMWGKNLSSQLKITQNSCYYPPLNRVGFWGSRKNSATTSPPLNRVGFWGSWKNSATTPPPTESRRLLEITEKTREIQQAQLGSSDYLWMVWTISMILLLRFNILKTCKVTWHIWYCDNFRCQILGEGSTGIALKSDTVSEIYDRAGGCPGQNCHSLETSALVICHIVISDESFTIDRQW